MSKQKGCSGVCTVARERWSRLRLKQRNCNVAAYLRTVARERWSRLRLKPNQAMWMWQVCPVARERWSRLRLKLAHPSQFNRIYISGKGAVVSPEIETQSRSASASVKSGWQGSGGLA